MDIVARIALFVAAYCSYLAYDHAKETHTHLHEIGCYLEASDQDGVTFCAWVERGRR